MRHLCQTFRVLLDQLEKVKIPLGVVESAAFAMHLVREAASCHEHNLQIFRVALDRLAQALSEPVAPSRRGIGNSSTPT